MSTPNFMTFHLLNVLPWHNLNRGENGAPKTLRQGGAVRGMLSAQSLKRAARVAYETQMSSDVSFRSASGLPSKVLDRAIEIAAATGVTLDEAKARKDISAAISSLVAKPKGEASDEDKKDTNVWLSADEVGLLAQRAVETQAGNLDGELLGNLGTGKKTASLGIAAFGRMFANANDRQTEAAIAVSPATTTHKLNIEVDYFTVVDDLPTGEHRGASYLDVAQFTSGVYYRSFTIDRAQLHAAWADIDADDAPERLTALLRSLVYALPAGKKTSTAPNTRPAVVLAEQQTVRQAYEFDTPVVPAPNGGFTGPSIDQLLGQRNAAVSFDPALFGDTWVVGNVDDRPVADATVAANLDEVVAHAVEWALAPADAIK